MSICDKCGRESECPVAHEDDFCLNYVRKPQTNADRIRAMSDEELAVFMTSFWYDGPKYACPVLMHIGEDKCYEQLDCRECWLDWLRQEATE